MVYPIELHEAEDKVAITETEEEIREDSAPNREPAPEGPHYNLRTNRKKSYTSMFFISTGATVFEPL